MKRILYIIIGITTGLLTSCSDDEPASAAPQQEVTVVNVDVILPLVQWSEWQPAIEEALNYIELAQEPEPTPVTPETPTETTE